MFFKRKNRRNRGESIFILEKISSELTPEELLVLNSEFGLIEEKIEIPVLEEVNNCLKVYFLK